MPPRHDTHALAGGKGGYTTTNPQLRRVKPEAVGNRVCVKVVYVVLEAQYQSALSNAVKNINAKNDKVCQGVGQGGGGAWLGAEGGHGGSPILAVIWAGSCAHGRCRSRSSGSRCSWLHWHGLRAGQGGRRACGASSMQARAHRQGQLR